MKQTQTIISAFLQMEFGGWSAQVTPLLFVCNFWVWSMFWNAVLCVLSSLKSPRWGRENYN